MDDKAMPRTVTSCADCLPSAVLLVRSKSFSILICCCNPTTESVVLGPINKHSISVVVMLGDDILSEDDEDSACSLASVIAAARSKQPSLIISKNGLFIALGIMTKVVFGLFVAVAVVVEVGCSSGFGVVVEDEEALPFEDVSLFVVAEAKFDFNCKPRCSIRRTPLLVETVALAVDVGSR